MNRTIPIKITVEANKLMAKERVLFKYIFRILSRQGKPTRPIGIVWLESKGINIPYSIDFYAVLLFCPFIFSIALGSMAEANLFDEIHGLNIIIVSFLLILMLILADYYHNLGYFDINLKLLRIIPLSNSQVFRIKFLLEIFGYKIYVLFSGLMLLAIFNHSYIEKLKNPLHPKLILMLVNIYLFYCLLKLVVNQISRITIGIKWYNFTMKFIAAFVIVIFLKEARLINTFDDFISLKASNLLNNGFWLIQVTILGMILTATLTLKKLVNWKS